MESHLACRLNIVKVNEPDEIEAPSFASITVYMMKCTIPHVLK
jgi:hypothetical protein